jgi:DHA2 family methylenomycin A resistance protein-like MFS transporter
VLLMSGGVLADRFGARRVYLWGLGGFAGASLVCALAPNAAGLIVGRAAQGVAAAAMIPSSLALVNHAASHDPALRARAIGWWTAVGSIAIASGPIASGLLLAAASWPSIFLINLPVCAVGAFLTLRATAREPVSSDPPHRRKLDLPGQLLVLLALSGLIAALIEIRPLGARDPLVAGGLLIAIAAAAALVWAERRSAEPLLPVACFRSSNFRLAVLYGIAVNLTYYGVVFVLSLYLQRVRGYSALQSGLAYLPLTASFFGVNVFSGWLVGKVGSRWPMLAGALIDAVGFGLLLGLDESSPYWQMLPAFALIPIGMGLGVPAMTNSVLASVDKRWSGSASAALNAARQAGGAIGVALFGSLAGAQVVAGLHQAAALSVGLLLLAATLVVLMFRRPAAH